MYVSSSVAMSNLIRSDIKIVTHNYFTAKALLDRTLQGQPSSPLRVQFQARFDAIALRVNGMLKSRLDAARAYAKQRDSDGSNAANIETSKQEILDLLMLLRDIASPADICQYLKISVLN